MLVNKSYSLHAKSYFIYFSRFISFAMHLDAIYIKLHIKIYELIKLDQLINLDGANKFLVS
jgi:hypothetical protein